MNGQHRKNIHPGLPVAIVLKKDQRTGRLTGGIVKDILCRSLSKPPRHYQIAKRQLIYFLIEFFKSP